MNYDEITKITTERISGLVCVSVHAVGSQQYLSTDE